MKESILKDFLEFIPDMVCIVDDNGIIVDCNNIQAEKLGFTKNELIGKSGFDLIADNDKRYAQVEFQKLEQQNRVENIELWGLTKNGKYRALTTTSKITDSDGEKRYLIVTKDITQQYIQQKKIQEIRKNFSSLGEITSKIAHDIRNPLTVMKSHISIIDKEIESESLKKRLANMDQLVSDISSIVSDVVNYTRIDPDSKEKIRADKLMDVVCRGITVPNGVILNYSGKDTTIWCDKNKIGIVLRNLISNSIDAIDCNGKINIEFSENNTHSTIKVVDSGEGIPSNISSNVFDLLFTTKTSGTGLGLSICKNIVESHGGTISFSNNPTTFMINLPKN